MRIASCNPAEIKDHAVPPAFSGLPAEDRGRVGRLLGRLPRRPRRDARRLQRVLPASAARRRCPRDDFIHESPWLNLYLYPEEVDYPRARPLGRTWHNLQASVRATDPAWELPEALAGGDGPLVYLSLGSLGSADVELMRKLGRRARRRAATG